MIDYGMNATKKLIGYCVQAVLAQEYVTACEESWKDCEGFSLSMISTTDNSLLQVPSVITWILCSSTLPTLRNILVINNSDIPLQQTPLR